MPPAAEVTQVATPRVEARLAVDARGQIHEANPSVHHLLGYQPGALVGLSLAWIMPPSQHSLLGELTRAFRDARCATLSAALMREDGSLLPVVMTAEPCISARGRRRLALRVAADAPEAPPVEFIESLAACRELLRWLDGQLQHQSTRGIPRNGPLAAVVLDEASALLDQCRAALSTLPETTDSGIRRPRSR